MRSFLAPALLLLAAPAWAQSARSSADDAGLPPLAVEPVVRWSFGPLAFEGPALAAAGFVLAHGRDSTGRRALVVLEGEDGRVLSRTLFSSVAPLALDLAGERVAVRSAAGRVDLMRLRRGRLLVERSFLAQGSLSVPLLEDEQLFLREGDELVAYDLDRREPLWRARAPGPFRGTPALRGGHLLAVWYEASGSAHLAWLERASGRVLGDVVLGRHRHEPSAADLDALLVVAHDESVFVRLRPGLPTTSGHELEWARVAYEDERLAGAVTLHDLLAEPLETGAGWVAPERARDGDARWILVRRDARRGDGRERAIELASSAHHAWLGASTTPASRAGDVLYLGPCAADRDSLQVLWRREHAPAFRPLPVPGGLLVVEGELLHRLGAATSAPARTDEPAHALAARLEKELGDQLVRIAMQALRTGDGELAAGLVAEAEALGASERTLGLVKGEAQRAAATPPSTRTEPRRNALLAEAARAREALPDGLAESARAQPHAARKRAILAELFRRAPEHAAGIAELRRHLPPGALIVPGDARSWLELLEISATLPIGLLPAAQDGPALAPEQQRLATERTLWRSDVLGYQSERLLVVTAGAAPGAVARTLQAGELVCDVLERTFGGARGAAGRLELVLYPTRAEYLEHSGSDLGGLESVLGFTAGHFDLAAQVSRLFLPSEDENDARLLCVSAHELTHHWLATRSGFGPPRAEPTTPGFWVVEAIATWVEELRLDTLRRTWAADPARSASLDTLINAGAGDLLPWRTLLGASFDEYRALETRPTCALSLDWQLGARAPRSPLQLFYAQGGALAHYLSEGEGGARRALLLRAVEAYYRGTPLDVAAALGVTPEELGARVGAWARAARGSGSG